MLTQFLELIFDLKPQLPEGFNIDLVFAGTPVLRVDDTNIQFAQAGAIRFQKEPYGRFSSVAADPATT